jgi:small redox-active disulfide protein 2
MDIKILGTGCPKCKSLEKLTKETLETSGIEANLSKEEDIMKIMQYGVMKTPGLVINEKVVFSGRLPSKTELEKILNDNK